MVPASSLESILTRRAYLNFQRGFYGGWELQHIKSKVRSRVQTAALLFGTLLSGQIQRGCQALRVHGHLALSTVSWLQKAPQATSRQTNTRISVPMSLPWLQSVSRYIDSQFRGRELFQQAIFPKASAGKACHTTMNWLTNCWQTGSSPWSRCTTGTFLRLYSTQTTKGRSSLVTRGTSRAGSSVAGGTAPPSPPGYPPPSRSTSRTLPSSCSQSSDPR
mmetsp:Transcript_5611/g.13622  ORF Transcript_5611/g.13622 Transcript_5611/m.13622 type:complete len:219 (+) Transcript_5611:407-1063(+)